MEGAAPRERGISKLLVEELFIALMPNLGKWAGQPGWPTHEVSRCLVGSIVSSMQLPGSCVEGTARLQEAETASGISGLWPGQNQGHSWLLDKDQGPKACWPISLSCPHHFGGHIYIFGVTGVHIVDPIAFRQSGSLPVSCIEAQFPALGLRLWLFLHFKCLFNSLYIVKF